MILIRYFITLPAENTIRSVLNEVAPILANSMKECREYCETLENCDITIEHNTVENIFTTSYRWTDQQAIDSFYTWAENHTGNYDNMIAEFNAIIEAAGGTVVRTVDTI